MKRPAFVLCLFLTFLACSGGSADQAGLGEDCESSDSCPSGSFCQFLIGTCQAKGICLLVPDACTEESLPVCGCDGKTYSNLCAASLNKVSVHSSGECR